MSMGTSMSHLLGLRWPVGETLVPLVHVVTWPFTLSKCEFPGDGAWGGETATLAVEAVVHITLLTSVHTQALLAVCSRKTEWKSKGRVSRTFQTCILHSALCDKFYK